jgi:hypothetical protein
MPSPRRAGTARSRACPPGSPGPPLSACQPACTPRTAHAAPSSSPSGWIAFSPTHALPGRQPRPRPRPAHAHAPARLVVDEVHERDVLARLALVLLREHVRRHVRRVLRDDARGPPRERARLAPHCRTVSRGGCEARRARAHRGRQRCTCGSAPRPARARGAPSAPVPFCAGSRASR